MDDWPLALSSPMTSQENCFTRMRLPTGSALPNRFLRTVSPMTQTTFPARSSDSSNVLPLTRCQLPAVKYEFVVPVTDVDQFFAPATTVTLVLAVGATALALLICVRIASASA